MRGFPPINDRTSGNAQRDADAAIADLGARILLVKTRRVKRRLSLSPSLFSLPLSLSLSLSFSL